MAQPPVPALTQPLNDIRNVVEAQSYYEDIKNRMNYAPTAPRYIPYDEAVLVSARSRAIKLGNLYPDPDIPTPAEDLAAIQALVATLVTGQAALRTDLTAVRTDLVGRINALSKTLMPKVHNSLSYLGRDIPWQVVPFVDGTMPPADLPGIHNVDDLEHLTIPQLNTYLQGHGLTVPAQQNKQSRIMAVAQALGVVGSVMEDHLADII
ncbi:hypothetical protein PENSPDRAFT_752747 [Peniophora sp. CONT]|nr:hypothetical protein PENSPDRAFT_752747 [Peniophora sp. CONT]